MSGPTETPRRLVLLGHPVSHSLSPRMHAAALAALDVPLTYDAIDVEPEQLDVVLDSLIRERAAGNVTIPHKARVVQRCGRVTARARRAGAVNVFWVEQGTLAGDNTDIPGFAALAAAALGRPPAGERIALLGAGGAASAVLAAVEQWPESTVALYNRTPERAAALASRFSIVRRVDPSAIDTVRDATLVVNATSLGLHEADPFPLPIECLPAGTAVADLVYRPGGTRWVREATSAGLRARDGLEMLLEQGALALERWLGVPAPRTVMRDALVRAAAGDVS